MDALWPRKCPKSNLPRHPTVFPPRTSPGHISNQFIIHFYWPSRTAHEKIILVCPGAGDLIQLSSVNQRKTSLAWHKSASPPQNLLSHTHTQKSRSVLRNNLPSQPSGDDVSFLITNCLFMLQQLPREANKWLKECLDQAFRPHCLGVVTWLTAMGPAAWCERRQRWGGSD